MPKATGLGPDIRISLLKIVSGARVTLLRRLARMPIRAPQFAFSEDLWFKFARCEDLWLN